MNYFSEDPVRDAEQYLTDVGRRLAFLPVCARCGEPIQQELAVRLDGQFYCDDCLDVCRAAVEYS